MGKNILRKHFQNMYGNNKPLQSNKNTNNLLKNISVNNAEGENYVENKTNNMNIKNLISNAEKESAKYSDILPKVSTPSVFGFGGVLLLTAFLMVLMTIIYFRDSIMNYFKELKDSLVNGISQSSSPYKSLEQKYNDIMSDLLQETSANEQNIQSKTDELHLKNTEIDTKNNELQSKNNELQLKTDEYNQLLKTKEDEIEQLNKTLNQKEIEEQTRQSQINSGAIGQVNNKLSEICKYNTNVLKDGYCYIGYDLGKRECTDVYAGDICMSGKIFPTMAQCQNPSLR
jgi:DNA repair exonuclease SbcCD ATPase subunit